MFLNIILFIYDLRVPTRPDSPKGLIIGYKSEVQTVRRSLNLDVHYIKDTICKNSASSVKMSKNNLPDVFQARER